MDHLTNLYKHKCEQLQEQINNIKRMLNEAEAPPIIISPNIANPWIPNIEPNPFGVEWVGGPKPPPPKPKPPEPLPRGFPKPKYEDPRNHDPANTPEPAGIGGPPDCPYPNGSPQWRKWVQQAGNWHYNNPYTYRSPAWFMWERLHYPIPIDD